MCKISDDLGIIATLVASNLRPVGFPGPLGFPGLGVRSMPKRSHDLGQSGAAGVIEFAYFIWNRLKKTKKKYQTLISLLRLLAFSCNSQGPDLIIVCPQT